MTYKVEELVIFKGGSLNKRVAVIDTATGLARNLTGYHAKLQIRDSVDSAVALVTLDDAGNGGLTIQAAQGFVDIGVGNTVTAGYTFTSGVWDLRINASGSDTYEYLCGGAVTVRKMSTQ